VKSFQGQNVKDQGHCAYKSSYAKCAIANYQTQCSNSADIRNFAGRVAYRVSHRGRNFVVIFLLRMNDNASCSQHDSQILLLASWTQLGLNTESRWCLHIGGGRWRRNTATVVRGDCMASLWALCQHTHTHRHVHPLTAAETRHTPLTSYYITARTLLVALSSPWKLSSALRNVVDATVRPVTWSAGHVRPRWRGTAPFFWWSSSLEYWKWGMEELLVQRLTSTSGQCIFQVDTTWLSVSPTNLATSTEDK